VTYSLKSYLEQNYSPTQTAQEIYADLSEVVVLDDDLTKSELATFFAFNPQVKLRLQSFVATVPAEDSPLFQVWGIAGMALDLLTIPDLEINPAILAQGLAALRAANLITDPEYAALEPFITSISNKGTQTLGYLPTVEQIQAALDLSWPTQS
jgi:hypothetical protein